MENTLLVDALIYLAAAVIAVPIAKRCGVGAVLGYLLAGIAIGPWGFRVINDVEDILHFSEFGVVLLLFLIGLELEPKRLWSLRRSIFGWGGMQVVGVSAALFAAGVAAGIEWPVALIAALGLSLSSTAVALATLQERHLMATAAGAAGFAILLFQDIAAIPMIAVVPMLGDAAQTAHGPGWLKALKVLAVIAALVASSRFLLRPLLRIIAKTDMREIFTAFALLLVIAIGLLMESVGMSMALGTFLAGVLLADSEFRHALESDLEPFKGLLLGLFFIAVGMSIDFGIFLSQPLLIAGILFAFLAIKMAVLYGLSKLFRISSGEQLFFAFILSQGGEFAFVVFGAAEKANVFSKEVSSVLVAVVALSMMITPLLLVVHDKFIAPRFARGGETRPDDEIEHQHNEVIVAGFGRVGQIVVRLLRASRIGTTVLDHDIDQVELLRKFGFKVFYGNPSRIELLESAGARDAKVMVVAIDDAEESLKLVRGVKRAFPHLKIVARARNVSHYYDLLDLGVHVIERETFESSVQLGGDVLRELGFGAYEAHKIEMKFREHNIKTLYAVYPHYKNQENQDTMISLAVQARQELEDMFARDAEALENERNMGGWNEGAAG